MAAIDHAFTEQNTDQSSTSTSYVDITGAAIASGEFTAGKKYLIVVTAQIGASGADSVFGMQALHGSTPFADSELIHAGSTARRVIYQWFDVWTAVSSEGIKLQFKTDSNTVVCDQISLLAINLTDDLIENTHWFYDGSSSAATTDAAISTTPTDGASITFTPATAAHDWLVLASAQVQVDSAAQTPITSLVRSGEAASAWPAAGMQTSSTSNQTLYMLANVFTLGAASNTFKEQIVASTGSSNDRLQSKVFALDLNLFKNHAFAATEADADLGTTDFGDTLQTVALTPDVSGPVWILGYWGFDSNNNSRTAETRIQVDDADVPAGQTTDIYRFRTGNASTNEDPIIISTLTSLDTTAHTIDLDAGADSTIGVPAGQHRILMAATMELAAEEEEGPTDSEIANASRQFGAMPGRFFIARRMSAYGMIAMPAFVPANDFSWLPWFPSTIKITYAATPSGEKV